jgi:two-component system, chemotaxis family, protein-glutamate methylesterase/glutaminase
MTFAAGSPFDAIVIGGSAGAVAALTTILPAMRAGLGCPVFVVVHLPPARESLLVNLLAQQCALAVKEAEDKEIPQPGTIYVAPPDYHLLVESGPMLALSADEPVLFSRPSIDVLFESAADAYQNRLLAIVLSGASEDGAAGLAAVRQAGGMAIVQDPATAPSALMPQAARLRSGTEHVLALPELEKFAATLI